LQSRTTKTNVTYILTTLASRSSENPGLFRVKHFKLWQAPIFKSFELRKFCIPLSKALKHANWLNFWNWELLYTDRHKIHFTQHAAFSFKQAWQPIRWCHAQFYPAIKSPLIGLSNDVSFVSKLFWKVHKLAEIFCWKLAVKIYMSTSVPYTNEYIQHIQPQGEKESHYCWFLTCVHITIYP